MAMNGNGHQHPFQMISNLIDPVEDIFGQFLVRSLTTFVRIGEHNVSHLKCMAIGPQGRVFAGSYQSRVFVWREGMPHSTFNALHSPIYALSANSNSMVFSSHEDGTIRIWGDVTGEGHQFQLLISLPSLPNRGLYTNPFEQLMDPGPVIVSSLCLSVDARFVYAGLRNGIVKIWLVEGFVLKDMKEGHSECVNAIVADSQGRVVSASEDGSIFLYQRFDVDPDSTVHHFRQQLQGLVGIPVRSLYFQGGLYAGMANGNILYWTPSLVEAPRVLNYHLQPVSAIAGFPASGHILSGCEDGNIAFWKHNLDGNNHNVLFDLNQEIGGHMGAVISLLTEVDWVEEEAFHKFVLYSCSVDSTLKIWRISIPIE